MAATTDYDLDTKGASFLTDTDRLFFLMEEVTRRLRRTADSSVEQFGLTRTQWRILAYLSEPRHDPDRAGSGTEARAR